MQGNVLFSKPLVLKAHLFQRKSLQLSTFSRDARRWRMGYNNPSEVALKCNDWTVATTSNSSVLERVGVSVPPICSSLTKIANPKSRLGIQRRQKEDTGRTDRTFLEGTIWDPPLLDDTNEDDNLEVIDWRTLTDAMSAEKREGNIGSRPLLSDPRRSPINLWCLRIA